MNEVHAGNSCFPGGEWVEGEEEAVNTAGTAGGNVQVACVECTREVDGSVGPG